MSLGELSNTIMMSLSVCRKPFRLVVLISGTGTNLQAIIDAIADGRLNDEIVLVVSNRKTAFGLQRAKNSGIAHTCFPFSPYREASKTREQYDADLAAYVSGYHPDLIILAGWMHIFSSAFLECFPLRVINLHPALPETFPGMHAIERTYSAFQRGEVSHGGCMVHSVIPEVDAGEVILQRIVPIRPDDSLEQFERSIHEAEHRILVEAIRGISAKAKSTKGTEVQYS